jgi:hypothetical protein
VRGDRNGDAASIDGGHGSLVSGDRNGDAASIDGGHGSLVSGTEMNRETSCVPVSFPRRDVSSPRKAAEE